MFIKYILLILISIQLYATNTLNKVYYINSNSVKLKNIIPQTNLDIELFSISTNKHSKKITSEELIKILKNNGYDSYVAKHRYIKFIIKSPINTSRIKLAICEYYKSYYKEIDIQYVYVEPRTYITSLPEAYIVHINKKNHLKKSGTLSIKTPKNKKIFFNYNIQASVTVYISKRKIKKDVELSSKNITKKRVPLDKFRATPYQNINSAKFQAKHNIGDKKVITIRDIQTLSVIKRNSNIQITINKDNMDISFSAKALQNGKLNDIIKVQKSNGKILKVIVTGRNKAEMR